MTARFLSILALAAAACHGRYGGGPAKPVTPAAGQAAPMGPKGIVNAALPYQVLDERTGHQITEDAFWDKLAAARAVCVGEEHPNPHHHWVQLHVVETLAKKWPKLALGMEMFQRPFQGVLDDYDAKRIDDAALRSRSGWEDRWGYDWGFYGPTIDVARDAHGVLLALNAAKELTKKVVHHGLESLTADEKKQVPDLKLDDKAHRAWFDSVMEEMGGGAAHSSKSTTPHDEKDAKPNGEAGGAGGAPEMPSADRIYLVQVIWDETMADTAVSWLKANPDGRIVILAGTGHCHDSAIVGRMKRRGIADVVSIRSVIDDDEGSVAEALAKPMNDFLVVLEPPKQPGQK